MVEIIWTSSALTDLNEIGEFIALDSPKYAEITVNKIYSRVGILPKSPRIGRIVPEIQDDNVRELIEGNYRIIYELAPNTIYILTIHHSSRMLRVNPETGYFI